MRERIFSTYLIGFDEDHFDVKVMYSDIFLIEVIPYTHYCNVYYKNNSCRLYYDSGMLMKNLGKEFLKISASAIVCVNKIIMIDKQSRLLFLREDLFCVYARVHWGELKEALALHSYRTAKGQTQEKKDYMFAYEKDYLLRKIEKSDIYFIESIAESHRCKVISKFGVYELRGDLSVIAKELTGNFLKCRRNCIVNMDYVIHIDMEEKCLQLQAGFSCTYESGREKQIVDNFFMDDL